MITLPVRNLAAQFERFSGYPVRIEIFEGPLDLLLHLVRREEVQASEVDIARITSCDQHNRSASRRRTSWSRRRLLLLKSRALLPRVERPEDKPLGEDGTGGQAPAWRSIVPEGSGGDTGGSAGGAQADLPATANHR